MGGWRRTGGYHGQIVMNRFSPLMLEYGPNALQLLEGFPLKGGGMQPLRAPANLPVAAMTWSSGVMSRLVMHLCLWNTVAKIRVTLVSFIHIIHER